MYRRDAPSQKGRKIEVRPVPVAELGGPEQRFSVMWRSSKRTKSPHVKWEGDGVLVRKMDSLVLLDLNDNELARKTGKQSIEPELFIGRYLVQLGDSLDVQSPSCRVIAKPPPPKPHKGPKTLDPVKIKTIPGAVEDVQLDPFIVREMRPHQIEGVRFLYDCVMGIRNTDHFGAVLADEMGLGKSLQAIALIWTLLKQNSLPLQGSMLKVLLVCPVSLLAHWQAEFKKWLGDERISVYCVTTSVEFTDFIIGRKYQVMLIGYEKMVSSKVLEKCQFDLILCDEGHRLKSTKLLAVKSLCTQNTLRRVVMTGTLLQNDLSEYFAVMNFVNPGALGSHAQFKAEIEAPLSENGSEAARASAKLALINNRFLLRRTTATIEAFLKPKTLYLVFLRSKEEQRREYLECTETASDPLSLLTKLKTICSTSNARTNKLELLERLIVYFGQLGEKTVVVSHYTRTLDMLEKNPVLSKAGILRLDGSTPVGKRQQYVDSFNTGNKAVFLLSSKAGGLGLNLTGASRLVLYDLDWNPAFELQAMARIWRDGQTRPVHIYRLVLENTIEELILDRQRDKIGLSAHVVDGETLVEKSFGIADVATLREMVSGGYVRRISSEWCQITRLHDIATDELVSKIYEIVY